MGRSFSIRMVTLIYVVD